MLINAERSYKQAFMDLLSNNPFYAYVVIQMNKVYTRNVPIAGVNIIGTSMYLYLNPDTFPKFTKQSRAGILEHEVNHLVLHHLQRIDSRNHKLWNVATDFAINSLIGRDKLPSTEEMSDVLYDANRELMNALGINKEDYKTNMCFPDDFGLPNKKTAEWYYDEIINNDELKEELQGEGGDGDCFFCGGDREGEGGEGDDGDEDGDSNECPACNGFDKDGQYRDSHKKWRESSGMSESAIEDVIRHTVKDAYNRSRGIVPGNIREEIEKLMHSKVDWRTETRRFIARSVKANKKYTWKRPSRRYPDAQGTSRERILNLVVAIDTSGSISNDEAALFVGEVDRIYNSIRCNIWVIDCDTKIQNVEKYKPGKKIKIVGRGGTDLRPPFEWVKSQREQFDALIYLTDLGGPIPEKETIPTLWAVTEWGWNYMDDPNLFGRKVKLEVKS